MGYVGRGKITHGGITLTDAIPFPEGAEVIVQVEAVQVGDPDIAEDFANLEFFGLWADRHDLSESVDWVREQREAWHQRATRSD